MTKKKKSNVRLTSS